ncbi:MAG: T9SS type A sorting domain-containing protein, partial [Ginsengibacter sp.]
VSVNNIQFTLNGTLNASDLALISIYYNATAPTISGSSLLNNAAANFASGHTYGIPFGNPMEMGASGYYIISVNVNSTATVGHTVLINGATNPVVFGFTTAPNITNNQTDLGGVHTLPLSFISVNAFEKVTGIEIEWKVAFELNLDKYVVEKSSDGKTFNPIGHLVANNNFASATTYDLLDTRPLPDNNFYRISAINKDGKIQYSPVVKIHINKGKEGISIYPNPIIKNQPLTVAFKNLDRNEYTINIFNHQGQLILTQKIDHGGGNSVQTIILPKVAAGIYSIEVMSTIAKFVKRLIIE